VYKPTVNRYTIGCLRNEHASTLHEIRLCAEQITCFLPDPQNLHVFLDAYSTKASEETLEHQHNQQHPVLT
jgi:hypothetical protein